MSAARKRKKKKKPVRFEVSRLALTCWCFGLLLALLWMFLLGLFVGKGITPANINFAEIKNSSIGAGTHVGHFSYVGDSAVGRDVNIGAGTVTANFDGDNKHETIIGDRVKIGSDTVIVAPVRIGDDASTGAGAVVNRDVAAGETVVGVPAKPVQQRSVSDSE